MNQKIDALFKRMERLVMEATAMEATAMKGSELQNEVYEIYKELVPNTNLNSDDIKIDLLVGQYASIIQKKREYEREERELFDQNVIFNLPSYRDSITRKRAVGEFCQIALKHENLFKITSEVCKELGINPHIQIAIYQSDKACCDSILECLPVGEKYVPLFSEISISSASLDLPESDLKEKIKNSLEGNLNAGKCAEFRRKVSSATPQTNR